VYLHARRITTNTPWLCYTIHHWSIIIKCFRRWKIECCCYDKVCMFHLVWQTDAFV